MSAVFHIWRLHEGADAKRGLACDGDGLRLGGVRLIERVGAGYRIRPEAELTRLLAAAYGVDADSARLISGLAVVAKALDSGDLCRAAIAAVQLRLPDLPDAFARAELQIEDATLRFEKSAEALARYSVDQPRAGVPPNPGWFAPKDGGGLEQIAQEEDRDEEEAPDDSLAPVRQALWNAQLQILRQLDPKNPNLTYFANPNSVPTQAQLNRLNDLVRQVATQRVLDRLMPYGKPIGQDGKGIGVREVRGGLEGAQKMFDYLSIGGTKQLPKSGTTVTVLPGGAGYITLRPKSDSGPPAVDVNLTGRSTIKLHFP